MRLSASLAIPILSLSIFSCAIGSDDPLTQLFENDPLFVATSNGSSLYYSEDGANWNSASIAGSSLRSITYGEGVFVTAGIAAGPAGRAWVSEDAMSWSISDLNITGAGLMVNSVRYLHGSFYVVGAAGGIRFIYRSHDGSHWAQVANIGGGTFWDISASDDMFLAVGDGNSDYSYDGQIWNPIPAPPPLAGSSYCKAIYAQDRFVIAAGSPARIYTSTDGFNFSGNICPGGIDYLSSIAYGQGRFVAVGRTFAGTIATAVSYNGTTWLTSFPGPGWEFRAVAYGLGRFIAGDNGVRIWSSPDGISWSTVFSSGSIFTDMTYRP